MMHVTCAQDHDLILKGRKPRLFCQQHQNHTTPPESPMDSAGSWTLSKGPDSPLFPSSAFPTALTKKKRPRSRQDPRMPRIRGAEDSLFSEYSRQSSDDSMERPELGRRHSYTWSGGKWTRQEGEASSGRTKDRDESDMDWTFQSPSSGGRDARCRRSLQGKRATSTGSFVKIQSVGSPKDSEDRSIAKKRSSVQNIGPPLSINSNGVSIVVQVQGSVDVACEAGRERSPSISPFASREPAKTTTSTFTNTTTTQTTAEDVSQKLIDLQRRYDALHDIYGRDKMKNLKMKENLREIFGAFKLPVPTASTMRSDLDLESHGHSSLAVTQQRPGKMEWNPDMLEEYVQALRDMLVTEVTNECSRPVPDPRKKPRLDVMFQQLLHQH
ncbi:hypothetical protein EMPS_09401 [Entomortierella parvispora]|uniref:Uncharacterized protein n=1 Tax=Entomortierella parvispora TaxID=205924 RepID=A0A9P3HIR7_9FUNG|nr:hypothetical protein EMPS_09401 [Entomortierella parvispora]